MTGPRTSRACQVLVTAGEAEHNGKGSRASRYRLKPDAGAEQAPTSPATGSLSDERTPAPPDPAPPAEPPPPAAEADKPYSGLRGVSPRVRRELEREAAAPKAPPVDTLEPRILSALIDGPVGIRGLALRIGFAHPTDRLHDVLVGMVARGDITRTRNPDHSIGAERELFSRRA